MGLIPPHVISELKFVHPQLFVERQNYTKHPAAELLKEQKNIRFLSGCLIRIAVGYFSSEFS